jgi:hypothetical protein
MSPSAAPAIPPLHLLEQPHVLDRDHRLIGECRNQLDLLVGEGLYRAAHQQQYANRHSFSQERDAEHGAIAGSSLGFQVSVFRISQYIGNVNGFALHQDALHHAPTTRVNRNALEIFI